MLKDAILEHVFPIRFKTIKALHALPGPDSGQLLREAAQEARQVGSAYGQAAAAERWRILAGALDITALLMDWQHAVKTATIEADRFLRAAQVQLADLQGSIHEDQFSKNILTILGSVGKDFPLSGIADLCKKISLVPMPVAIYNSPVFQRPEWAPKFNTQDNNTQPVLAVAFIEFLINGTIVERIQRLRPRETYDLDIAVRISRWPEEAISLVLSPISIEPASTYELPSFTFDKPSGDPPFLFKQRGRMILHVPQNLSARPFEFMYTAEFQPTICEQPISIAGQRMLRLTGSNYEGSITGYPGIDYKLISLRDYFRLEPRILEQDIDDLLRVLVPIGNLMGQAVQDAIFSKVISEAEFQQRIREFLRLNPNIGVNLEEQAHSTGGRTDLSYRGIRIELKCEPKTKLLPEDCKKYVSQPASYAVGTNRRLAILCVLDCSPKNEAPFPIEDGLYVYNLDTGTSPVYIVICLIQGNLAKPSSLSR